MSGETMNVIALKREAKGLTQENLADLMKIDRTTISKWETGQAMPRADKLPVLAKLLDCTLEELLNSCKAKA